MSIPKIVGLVPAFVRLATLEKAQREDSFAPLTWSAGNQAQIVIEGLTPFASGTATLVREQRPEYDPVTS